MQRSATTEAGQKAFDHRLEDHWHPGQNMHIIERKSRRGADWIVDQMRPVGDAGHAQPRLVKLLSARGIMRLQKRLCIGPHTDRRPQSLRHRIGGDVIMGRANAARCHQMVVMQAQIPHRADNCLAAIANHSHFAQINAMGAKPPGKIMRICLAGAARKDLVSDHDHRGAGIWHGLGPPGWYDCPMEFHENLIRGKLIRRYKRFLADILLDNGREITAHCPNPGAMTGLADPDSVVWLEPNDDPKKKLKFGWRLTELPSGALVCVDTGQANRVVGEALRAGKIPGLGGEIRAEVPYGAGSRVDFLAGGVFVEVKSVTLSRAPGLAEFPDTVTKRGAKHLAELAAVRGEGARAVMLYLVMRGDCTWFRAAADIDPAYARAAQEACAAGVEFMAFSAKIAPAGINLGHAIEIC